MTDGEHVDGSAAPVRTSGGVPLTDPLLDRLAAEAEAGYDVSRLRPRGKRGPVPRTS